jgi:hypothetical protein
MKENKEKEKIMITSPKEKIKAVKRITNAYDNLKRGGLDENAGLVYKFYEEFFNKRKGLNWRSFLKALWAMPPRPSQSWGQNNNGGGLVPRLF